MSFTPLRSKGRDLKAWFATRPDLFVAERSPRKTTTWLVIAGAMAVLTLIVVANPVAVVELLGGRRSAGAAILGAFALPPALVVVSIAMVFLGARRWRMRGGGVLQNPVIHAVAATFPLQQLVAALRQGSRDESGIVAGFTAVREHPGDELLLTIWSSDADRAMFIGVLRVDGEHVWLDAEPIAVPPELYFDAQRLDRLAARGSSVDDAR